MLLQKKFPIIVTIITAVMFFSFGLLVRSFPKQNIFTTGKEIRNTLGYKFINPLLECDLDIERNDRFLTALKTELIKLVGGLVKNKKVNNISVYYRDLNNGPWLGINEKEIFSPASLLKVSTMMIYFKQSETDSQILQKEIINKSSPDDNQSIIPQITMEVNKKYTVGELIERMIVYSDNQASNLLVADLDPVIIDRTFEELGIKPITETTKPTELLLSVKEYASFFRILYNASYLNKQMSEKALQLLSLTEFKEGIVAGIPGGITVAHKFGERKYLDTNERQLHDCGIVYVPKDPYLLCVMTRGGDFEQQKKATREISSLVYKNLYGKE